MMAARAGRVRMRTSRAALGLRYLEKQLAIPDRVIQPPNVSLPVLPSVARRVEGQGAQTPQLDLPSLCLQRAVPAREPRSPRADLEPFEKLAQNRKQLVQTPICEQMDRKRVQPCSQTFLP